MQVKVSKVSDLPFRRECYICGVRLAPVKARVSLCPDCVSRWNVGKEKAEEKEDVPLGETDDRTPRIVTYFESDSSPALKEDEYSFTFCGVP